MSYAACWDLIPPTIRRASWQSGIGLMAILAITLIHPLPALSQVRAVVEGRVVEEGTTTGIQNAIVELEAHGTTLTGPDGAFRFEEVALRAYYLHIDAFGYTPQTRTFLVAGDMRVDVSLAVDPLRVDSIVVEMETLDFDGRVRDPARDVRLMNAHVLSSQGHDDWTDRFGRFDLDDVFAGALLRVAIRSFGYMPLDTTFIPDDDERYEFDLVPDPVMEKMIGATITRIEERAGENLYEFRPPLNRDDMSRFTGNGTLATMLEAKYPLHILRKVGCVMFDERHITDRQRRAFLLQNTFPEELERAEILEFPGIGRMLMLRVYTREFFMKMIATNQPLRRAYMRAGPIPICR